MKWVLLFVAGIWCIGCTTSEKPIDLEDLFTGDVEIIDLTHTLSKKAPFWPSKNGNPFEYDTLFTSKRGRPVMGAYKTPEHFGTHLDAPTHGGGLLSVDELKSKDLFGKAIIIDVSSECSKNADFVLEPKHIESWEEQNGRIEEKSIVFMYTGWSKKWGNYEAYINQDKEGKMHFPGFSKSVAHFLVEERKVSALGIDTMSTDASMAVGLPVHAVVNGSGKYQLENVANLHLIQKNKFLLIVAPIKLEGGSGGQVRLYAVIP